MQLLMHFSNMKRQALIREIRYAFSIYRRFIVFVRHSPVRPQMQEEYFTLKYAYYKNRFDNLPTYQ